MRATSARLQADEPTLEIPLDVAEPANDNAGEKAEQPGEGKVFTIALAAMTAAVTLAWGSFLVWCFVTAIRRLLGA